MDDEPQLQVVAIVQLAHGLLRCTVRCVAGTVRLGDTVELLPAGAECLTVSAIEYVGSTAMDFVDPGHTALVTVTGPIDVAAVRAVVPADLRLVVRNPHPA